jgi:hypothetical protein
VRTSILLTAICLVACQAPAPEADIGTQADIGTGINVMNNTDEVLHFRVFGDGKWVELSSIARPRIPKLIISPEITSDTPRLGPDGCTTGPLVALDPGGREVARHLPPLCIDDTWVIEGESR